MGPFPSKLEEIKLGWRLDALDGQGGWYAATVVQVSGVYSCVHGIVAPIVVCVDGPKA